MAPPDDPERALVDALDEPAFTVETSYVRVANASARALLGERIEGRDVRLAVRHPQALELILEQRSGDVDVTGIAEPGRSWRLLIRRLRDGAALVRMIDRSAAVSAEKMRVDFVANASHELRTPLSTVLGYAETLADENDLTNGQRASFGSTIRDEARRMLRIIEDLMSLSRIEADRFIAPGESVAVGEIVNAAVANVGPLREDGRCDIRLDLAPDLPPVRGDAAQLVQVLDNLIGNAWKYTSKVDQAHIQFGYDQEKSETVFFVRDNGAGFNPRYADRLFRPFQRLHSQSEFIGTGVGLATAYRIITRHNGKIWAKGDVDKGATFYFTVPYFES